MRWSRNIHTHTHTYIHRTFIHATPREAFPTHTHTHTHTPLKEWGGGGGGGRQVWLARRQSAHVATRQRRCEASVTNQNIRLIHSGLFFTPPPPPPPPLGCVWDAHTLTYIYKTVMTSWFVRLCVCVCVFTSVCMCEYSVFCSRAARVNPTGVLESKRWCIKGTVQQREVKMDFNRMYVHVCVHQRLRTVPTLQQNVSDHDHIMCLWPNVHVSRWRRWWSFRRFTICERVPTFVRVKPLDILSMDRRVVCMFVTSETSWMFFAGTVRTSRAQEPAATAQRRGRSRHLVFGL